MNIQEYIDLRVSLSGKTSRRAFWCTTLLHVVILLILIKCGWFDPNIGNIYLCVAYLILMPTFYTTMLVRRLNDVGGAGTVILPMCWLVPYLFAVITVIVSALGYGPSLLDEADPRGFSAMGYCWLCLMLVAGVSLLFSMFGALFFPSEETGLQQRSAAANQGHEEAAEKLNEL